MSSDFQAGTRIGQYVLDLHVGGGSFGAVWRGHDAGSGRTVAIKLLTGALASSDSISTRADVEVLAAAAARRSPHVVKVLDGGTDPLPYIVMEFIEGRDLQSLLQEQKQLSFEQTIDIGLAMADALGALYEAGIVHRDIKPANVMIDSAGVVKLADFGIAKIVGYETITTAGQAPMTMAYAAPEIWNEGGPFGHPSHKSDLYAMGVLLYQCLTGFTPFRGNYGALYRAHTEQTPDISALPADTPQSLRTLIRRSLEKRQEDRPSDALECKGILQRAQAELAAARGDATINEPRKFGPWIKDAPHDAASWAWRCHHESSGQSATVEMHFSGRLDYGDKLRKAVATNARLTPHWAERLIETNRLLLRPNEAWWEPPPGEFQFWVAREDLAVVPATRIGESQLRVAVAALRGLIDAAAEGVRLDLRGENMSVLNDGRIYLRRPGLAEPSSPDMRAAAMAFLSTLPLEPTARDAVASSTNLDELTERLTVFDPGATVIMDTTQLVRRPPLETQTQVTPLPATPQPEVRPAAEVPASPPARR
ncbi:MAG TPA: serine/threonine-protein kinase, partial [Dehalococcoidia bacterium]|nr:serine/threonine-protein kinase [Dehalococcoidia bacterium]